MRKVHFATLKNPKFPVLAICGEDRIPVEMTFNRRSFMRQRKRRCLRCLAKLKKEDE
jgi:hypothetical protein